MLESMKKRLTDEVEMVKVTIDNVTHIYRIPKNQEAQFQVLFNNTIEAVGGVEVAENTEVGSWRNSFSHFEDEMAAIGGQEKFRYVAILVKSSREAEKMTQMDLAEKLGVTQPYISDVERANKPIGKSVAKRLGEIFGVEPKLFLTDI